MSDNRWVETPMFILRRDCVEHATMNWEPGRFLEIGAGTGRLTSNFLRRGFSGVCYDLGASTRHLLRRNLTPFGTRVQVAETLDEVPLGSFDYVFAFEVLEHIEFDLNALRSWTGFLKPNGRILMSVPAHMRKYSNEDRVVGHYRRYEKPHLLRLFSEAGCSDVRVLSYGFPISIVTRRGNQVLARLRRTRAGEPGQTPEALSILSGIERSNASVRLAGVLNPSTLAPFIALQRLFFDSDLGDGYVVHATHVGHAG